MKTLLLSVSFLALCVPCYAGTAVLVYNITQEAVPWVSDVNDSSRIIGNAKTNLKIGGALIFDVNTATLEPVKWDVNDMNDAARLILRGIDFNKKRIDYQIHGLGNNVGFQKIAEPNSDTYLVEGHWGFIVEPNHSTETPWSSWARFFGKAVPTVIVQGSKSKVVVPRTLKGIGWLRKGSMDMSFDNGVGTGPVTLTLDLSLTKRLNQVGNATTTLGVKYFSSNVPPQPDPLTWVIPPTESGSSRSRVQSMQCGDAFSFNTPVSYKFVCIDDDNLSSGWQSSTSYTASVGTSHNYRWYVIARDSLGKTSTKKNAGLVIQQ